MKKMITFLIILLVILAGALVLTINYLSQNTITGEVVNEFSHTKAICDENNLCQDYEIYCKGNEFLGIKPTGYIVQNPDNWKDPRTPEEVARLCNFSG